MIVDFFNNLKQKTGYIFRLDDIAPNMNWEMMKRVKKLFNENDVKPVLGVIPKNEDNELKKYPTCNFNFWDDFSTWVEGSLKLDTKNVTARERNKTYPPSSSPLTQNAEKS